MLVGCDSCTVLSFDLDGFRFIISKGSKGCAMRRFTTLALLASFQGEQHFFVDSVLLR